VAAVAVAVVIAMAVLEVQAAEELEENRHWLQLLVVQILAAVAVAVNELLNLQEVVSPRLVAQV
jgi:hypothetical protein